MIPFTSLQSHWKTKGNAVQNIKLGFHVPDHSFFKKKIRNLIELCYLRKSRCPSLLILLNASAFLCLPKESFPISILACAMELTQLPNLQHLEMFSGLAFRLPYFRHSNTTFFLIINSSMSVWTFFC